VPKKNPADMRIAEKELRYAQARQAGVCCLRLRGARYGFLRQRIGNLRSTLTARYHRLNGLRDT
jgi:hypothetical protein